MPTLPIKLKKIILLLAAASLNTVAMDAAKAANLFADRSNFAAQLKNVITDDYENPAYQFSMSNAEMSAVRNETRYVSTAFLNLSLIPEYDVGQHGYCAGCNGSYLMDFSATSIQQTGGVFGVGFDYVSNGAPATVYVRYVDGTSENIALGTTDWGFFGLTSSHLIQSLAFGLPDGGATDQIYVMQDNLTIGQSIAAVPEPTEALMLSAGLLALAVARRRQSKAS